MHIPTKFVGKIPVYKGITDGPLLKLKLKQFFETLKKQPCKQKTV